ncbi:hypothetical protein BKA81DRAFT_26158 [Phyllosticta paracitricarpa]
MKLPRVPSSSASETHHQLTLRSYCTVGSPRIGIEACVVCRPEAAQPAQQGIAACDVRGHYHDVPFMFWSLTRSCMSNWSTATGSMESNAHLYDGVKVVFAGPHARFGPSARRLGLLTRRPSSTVTTTTTTMSPVGCPLRPSAIMPPAIHLPRILSYSQSTLPILHSTLRTATISSTPLVVPLAFAKRPVS